MSTQAQNPQHMQALDIANATRRANNRTKQEIAQLPVTDGARRVIAILSRPVGPAGAIQVSQLVRSIRFVADEKSTVILARAGIVAGTRPVRALTDRQRSALAAELRRRWL